MAVPEKDLVHIRRWCEAWVSDESPERVRLDMEVDDKHVVIIKRHAPWREGQKATAEPVARLRYSKKTGLWRLQWVDRSGRFHHYEKLPARDVRSLLDFLTTTKDPVFWG
jgi:hypothetical protein